MHDWLKYYINYWIFQLLSYNYMLNLFKFKFKLRLFFRGPSKNINTLLILINQFVYITFNFGSLNFLNSNYSISVSNVENLWKYWSFICSWKFLSYVFKTFIKSIISWSIINVYFKVFKMRILKIRLKYVFKTFPIMRIT